MLLHCMLVFHAIPKSAAFISLNKMKVRFTLKLTISPRAYLGVKPNLELPTGFYSLCSVLLYVSLGAPSKTERTSALCHKSPSFYIFTYKHTSF